MCALLMELLTWVLTAQSSQLPQNPGLLRLGFRALNICPTLRMAMGCLCMLLLTSLITAAGTSSRLTSLLQLAAASRRLHLISMLYLFTKKKFMLLTCLAFFLPMALFLQQRRLTEKWLLTMLLLQLLIPLRITLLREALL